MNKAAVWWRVSTDDQLEASPDTQIAESVAMAEREGFQVPADYIIGTDWGSLSVWDSPPMARLLDLVRSKEVSAVFMYDADRSPSRPVHRLLFRAVCEDNFVAIRCVHGQIPGGDMGEFVEFASAWSKQLQVHRAQQGAKDGLRDRAKKRGLPVTGIPPYGFRFRYQEPGVNRVPVALEPDPANYHIAVRIWRMAVDGVPMRRAALELAQAGIPAPKGGPTWNPSTIARILKNPAYAGRYAALRQEMKVPATRRKSDTYGKSSSRHLPMEEWQFLPDFQVESPIVTWAEWELVRKQLERNQADATRNGKRTYTLRGILFCSKDGRRLSGHSRKGRESYVYECPGRRGRLGVPKCACPRISGPVLEAKVWEEVTGFLGSSNTFQHEMGRRREATTGQENDIRKKMAGLERQLRDVARRETELVGLRLRGTVSDEALDRNAALLRAERVHYQEEIDRQQAALSTMEQSEAAVASLEALRQRFVDRLTTTAPEDHRTVLEALDTRVTIGPGGVLDLSIGVPKHLQDAMADCVHQPQGQ